MFHPVTFNYLFSPTIRNVVSTALCLRVMGMVHEDKVRRIKQSSTSISFTPDVEPKIQS